MHVRKIGGGVLTAISLAAAAMLPAVFVNPTHDTLVMIYSVLAVLGVAGLGLAFWPSRSVDQTTAAWITSRDHTHVGASGVSVQGEGHIVTVVHGAPPPPPPTAENARVFVPEQTTMRTLQGFSEGHTRFQADQLVEPYVGKWMALRGVVSDVAGGESNYSLVFVDDDHQLASSICCICYDKHSDRVRMLHKGQPISLIGMISRGPYGLQLENCELI